MYSGPLLKRNSSVKTPNMQKCYCSLWGTLLIDFENENDAILHNNPKCTIEIIGIAKWDGHSNSAIYPNGFLVVTHTGSIYYMSANSESELRDWMLHIRYALECNFANADVMQYKPSKSFYNYPPNIPSLKCAKSGIPFGATIPTICKSCGKGYLTEHVTDSVPLLQLSYEEAERICNNCFNAQICLLWLKSMNYVHVSELHEKSPNVLQQVNRYKASFKLRRHCSQALENAGKLLDENMITIEEFEELRKVDYDFRYGCSLEETEKLKTALVALGNDVQIIISLLSNPSATYSSRSMGTDIVRNSTMLYLQVIIRLIEIGDKEPDLLDFFWPQIIQIHLLLSKNKSYGNLLKLNMLQSAILSIAKKYAYFAIKLAWCIISSISDYMTEKKITQSQYAASLCLLLQLEIMCSGTAASLSHHVPINALPLNTPPGPTLFSNETIVNQQHFQKNSYDISYISNRYSNNSNNVFHHDLHDNTVGRNILFNIFHPSPSQQKEINFELFILFRSRSVIFNNYREKRFEYIIKEIDNVQRGWNTVENVENNSDIQNIEGQFVHLDENVGNAEMTKNRNNSVVSHNSIIEFPNPTIYDLMLHIGCMDYSKLTFPMPMAGGGVLLGHIFAHIAKDAISMYDKNAQAITPASNSTDLNNVENQSHRKSPLIGEGGLFGGAHVDSKTVSNVLKPTAYDYDYIAEWVNHRTDEIGLQLDFIESITYIVDNLRNVDRPLRTEMLKKELKIFLDDYVNSNIYGFDPTGAVTEPRYKIEYICIDECRVFRTKARAPSLIVCIVRRDDECEVEWSGKQMIDLDTKLTKSLPSTDECDVYKSRSRGESVGMQGDADSRHSTSAGVPSHFHRSGTVDVGALDNVIEGMSLPQTIASLQATQRARALSGPENTEIKMDLALPPSGDDEKLAAKTKSRLSSHPKNGRTSMILHSTSIEKEMNSSFGLISNVASIPEGNESSAEMVSPPKEFAAESLGIRRSHSETTLTTSHHDSSASIDKRPTSHHHHKIVSNAHTAEQSIIYTSETSQERSSPSLAKPSLSEGTRSLTPNKTDTDKQLNVEVTKKVVASAKALLNSGKISEKEYEMLLNCDAKYRDEAVRNEIEIANSHVEDKFGELYETKKQRLLSAYIKEFPERMENKIYSDAYSYEWPELDLRSFIVKSNDDLRQEVCCLQLIELCQEIFSDIGSGSRSDGCSLWLKTYRIASTNATSGVVQVIPDTLSLDALKKTEGFTTLSKHFEYLYSSSPERMKAAQFNFVSSLAAYSLVCYIFQIKDRHNGNILIDKDGHIIHIDFGFLLGIAPGGSFSIESAPFKLTEEMVDVFGGLDSPLFTEFLRTFTQGFLALKANSETIISTLSLMATNSTFPCFSGKDTNVIIDKLRARFRCDLNVKDTVQHCLDLIIESYSHYGTKQYDNFQWLTNGIMP